MTSRKIHYNEQTGNVDLQKPYLFYLNRSDGFTERLLSLSLFLDVDFKFQIKQEAFQEDSICLYGPLPEELGIQILQLLEYAPEVFEDEYNIHPGASDVGSYFIVFNMNGTSRNIHLGLDLESYRGNSEPEYLLFDFVSALNSWISIMVENTSTK